MGWQWWLANGMVVAYFHANPYDPKNGMEECLLRRCFMSFFQPGAAGLVFHSGAVCPNIVIFILGMPYIILYYIILYYIRLYYIILYYTDTLWCVYIYCCLILNKPQTSPSMGPTSPRTFHWTFSGQAVKETKTDSTSYTKGVTGTQISPVPPLMKQWLQQWSTSF